MCQGVCESNQALGYKFHRRLPTKAQAEATVRRAHLLRTVAETDGSAPRKCTCAPTDTRTHPHT